MNYAGFLLYQQTLSAVRYPLDDLNPYPLQAIIPDDLSDKPISLTASKQCYYKQSTGVRVLLAELLQTFAQQQHPLYLPEDVYPVYFQLAGEQAKVHAYQSCQMDLFSLPEAHHAVLLITHPLIPEGRYLSQQQLTALDQWLLASPQRWLLIDTVYDFQQQALNAYFSATQVIFLGSLSKLCLQPQTQGWALSNAPFLDAVEQYHTSLPVTKSLASARWLQQQFDLTWQHILAMTDIPNTWQAPEVGYLTVVEGDYQSLYQQLGIATVPSCVFGIKNTSMSVISCLALLKKLSGTKI